MVIKLHNIKIQTIIGTHEWERETRRELMISLQIEVEDESATQSDNLGDTVDYESLILDIQNDLRNSSFYLIERIAGRVLEIVMKDKRIQKALVQVDKHDAVKDCEVVSIICDQERK